MYQLDDFNIFISTHSVLFLHVSIHILGFRWLRCHCRQSIGSSELGCTQRRWRLSWWSNIRKDYSTEDARQHTHGAKPHHTELLDIRGVYKLSLIHIYSKSTTLQWIRLEFSRVLFLAMVSTKTESNHRSSPVWKPGVHQTRVYNSGGRPFNHFCETRATHTRARALHTDT